MTEMEFPEEMSGVKGPVTVLALVCPEPQHGQQAPVIVGTNAFLFHRLWDIAKETGSQHKVHSMKLQAVYKQIQSQENLPQRTVEEETIGQVKWQGPGPLLIAPGEKVYAICKVEKQSVSGNNIILIDDPVTQQLPAGVMIQPGVLPDTSIDANDFTVLLHNETQKPTSIQVGTVLAEMYAVDTVVSPCSSDTVSDPLDPERFDFGNSPVPENWKGRLRQELAARRDVFSVHEWEVGLAAGVEHQIRLSDMTPFKRDPAV